MEYNGNIAQKQNFFKKNFIKKLKEMNNNRRSTMDSENVDNSEPYLNLITQNFKSLNEKIDDISNTFQENRKTKNFLINFSENAKQIAFQDKNNKNLMFSSQQEENSINNSKKNNNLCHLIYSNRSLYKNTIPSHRVEVNELQKINEKYNGINVRLKGLISNLQTQDKTNKFRRDNTFGKRNIFNYLQKIEEKLGNNTKMKEESFQGLLNHLNYKSF